MPGGRPSKFTQTLANTICDRIAKGESVRRICEDANMPCRRTVNQWVADKEAFLRQYLRAREDQADFWAEQIIEISDNTDDDWTTKENADGSEYEAVDHEHIQRSRLRVDSRKWLASKLKPKRYGERTKHEHGGPNDGPIEHKWTVEMVEPDHAADS